MKNNKKTNELNKNNIEKKSNKNNKKDIEENKVDKDEIKIQENKKIIKNKVKESNNKKKNKKTFTIALWKLVSIILITVIAISTIYILIYKNFSNISQTIKITNQIISKNINIEDEIEKNKKLLGIEDVNGKGIIVSVNDGSDLIHQEDIKIIINQLKNAGAEAISINNIRYTVLSYIYCDGKVILMDNKKIGNPFTIKAIGDPETLYSVMTMEEGYMSVLKKDGIGVDVQKNDDIKILKTEKSEITKINNIKTKIGKYRTSNQLLGKEDMQGDGLEIYIFEKSSRISALTFIQIVNDLNAGGAYAISINGNRVVAMTDFMDISDKYVIMNSIPMSGPYLIKVIGDNEKINENIDYISSYFKKIENNGNEVEIFKSYTKVDKYEMKRGQDRLSDNYLE